MKSSDIHIRAISQEMPQPSITKICLKITCLKFNSNFPGASELTASAQKTTDSYVNYMSLCLCHQQIELNETIVFLYLILASFLSDVRQIIFLPDVGQFNEIKQSFFLCDIGKLNEITQSYFSKWKSKSFLAWSFFWSYRKHLIKALPQVNLLWGVEKYTNRSRTLTN